MQTVSTPETFTAARQERAAADSPAFDWAVALLSAWMIGGLYLDGWAHHQGGIESFFSPWHAVLYSGFLALAALLGGTFGRNLRKGAAWREALPAGYGQSLLGVLIFFSGGLGDMTWHTLFGIEEGIEALLSPTHLLLALGGALILTGPVRAALHRQRRESPGLPALLSLTLLLSVLAFFTAYAHPLFELPNLREARPLALRQAYDEPLVIAGVLVQSGLMMGIVLFTLRRWKLPFGSLALIFGLSTLMAVSIHENFGLALIGLAAGLAGDLLVLLLKPAPERPAAFRWFAFGVPAIFIAIYFATRILLGTLSWSVHLWAGTIVLAGVVGWLLSYAFVPEKDIV
jgi:hypothetical protein